MIRYKATTAAKDPETGELIYSGKTYGVRFENGIAWFDELTVDPKIGLPASEIARRMQTDFGYQIDRFNMDGTPYVEEGVDPKAAAKVTNKQGAAK